MFGALSLLQAAVAAALPTAQGVMPSFQARDLLGRAHDGRELRGRRAVVIAITSPDAASEARRWADALRARLDANLVEPVLLLALDLPFYVPDSLAMKRAREGVPRAYWEVAWLDTDGDAQAALALSENSPLPYVLAVGASGEIEAMVHGTVDAAGAKAVWEALEGR
jgi:hypothetical protein